MKEIKLTTNDVIDTNLSCSSKDEILSARIDGEVKRAIQKETELEESIKQAGKVDDVLVDNSSVVTNKVAKIDLQTIRDSISLEEARARGAEQSLSDDVSSMEQALETVDEAISNLEGMDKELQASIDAEADRAKDIEQTIADAFNDYINETDEHLDKLDGSISSLTTSIDDLSKKEAADVLGVQTSLATEIDDREKADNTLQSNIDAEVSRAKAVEKILADDLSSETSRAKEAEGTLAKYLSTESSTRESADTILQKNIDNSLAEAKEYADKQISVIEIDGGEVSQ
jgi:hypothetical protein